MSVGELYSDFMIKLRSTHSNRKNLLLSTLVRDVKSDWNIDIQSLGQKYDISGTDTNIVYYLVRDDPSIQLESCGSANFYVHVIRTAEQSYLCQMISSSKSKNKPKKKNEKIKKLNYTQHWVPKKKTTSLTYSFYTQKKIENSTPRNDCPLENNVSSNIKDDGGVKSQLPSYSDDPKKDMIGKIENVSISNLNYTPPLTPEYGHTIELFPTLKKEPKQNLVICSSLEQQRTNDTIANFTKLDLDNRKGLNNSENILPLQDCLTENFTALLPLIQDSLIRISSFKITDSCSKKTYSMGSGLKFSKDGTTGSLVKVNVAVNPLVDNIGNTKIKTTEKLATNPFKKAATIDSEVGNYENHFEKKSIFA